MKPLVIVGLVLVILGVCLLGYQGVAYFTTRETVAKVGPVEVLQDKPYAVWIGPIAGAVAIVGGVGLMVAGAAKKSSS
jgi:uncharacterized membrane protein